MTKEDGKIDFPFYVPTVEPSGLPGSQCDLCSCGQLSVPDGIVDLFIPLVVTGVSLLRCLLCASVMDAGSKYEDFRPD